MNPAELRASVWEGKGVDTWRTEWNVPELHVYQRIASTNDVVRRLAEEGAPERTVVIADAQTAGRGRAGRAWHAAPGQSLLLSTLLRPRLADLRDAAYGVTPLLMGLAVARAVEQVTDLAPGLKWPNDVVLERDEKLAGVLCEGALSGSGDAYVVVGIGINVAQSRADFPPEIAARATSLALAAGVPVSRGELAAALLAQIEELAPHAARPLDAGLLDELRRRDTLAGRTVRIDGRERGVASGFARDGALLVKTGAGIEAVRSGTVRAVEHAHRVPEDA